MARTSDTRDLARAAAQKIIDAGGKPTSRQIREILGVGSFTTIKEVLRDMGQDIAQEPVVGPYPAGHIPPPPRDAAAAEESGAYGKADGLPAFKTTEILLSLAEIKKELVSLRLSHEQQLAIAYERYEAVQRHALGQVDEARSATAQLRQAMAQLSNDVQMREDAQRSKAQALREENAVLRTKIEFLTGTGQARR